MGGLDKHKSGLIKSKRWTVKRCSNQIWHRLYHIRLFGAPQRDGWFRLEVQTLTTVCVSPVTPKRLDDVSCSNVSQSWSVKIRWNGALDELLSHTHHTFLTSTKLLIVRERNPDVGSEVWSVIWNIQGQNADYDVLTRNGNCHSHRLIAFNRNVFFDFGNIIFICLCGY